MSIRWLKRLPETVWAVLRLIRLYWVFLALPIVTAIAALELGAGYLATFSLAIAADFVAVLLWLFWFMFKWVVAESASYLWAYKPVRRFVLSLYAAGAIALAWWNLDVKEMFEINDLASYAYVGIYAEIVGLAFFHAALRLAKPTPSVDRFFVRLSDKITPRWALALRGLQWLLWLGGIALIDRWLYGAVIAWLGPNWIALPWEPVEKLRIPLAVVPPVVFTIGALLAGPPSVRRARPRWVLGLEGISPEQRERIFRLFRYVPIAFLKLQRKTVQVTLADGRTIEAGERFVFKRMWYAGVAFTALAAVAGFSWLAADFTSTLPQDLSALEAYQPIVSTRVFDRSGGEMCTFKNENRVFVPLAEIPKHVQEAFKASEDKNFDGHYGFDALGMIRAEMVNLAGGHMRQGASTLDQQLIKKIVLRDSSKSIRRKLSEVALAVRLERQMTEKYGRKGAKEKILEVYLNYVFLGMNSGGVAAAADRYFGKSVKDLSLAEAAMLAGLPKAPSEDMPIGHITRARVRQRYVLGRMLENGTITADARDAALAEKIVLVRRPYNLNSTAAPFACEHIRLWAEKQFGQDVVKNHGINIYSTISLEKQQKAQMAVRYGLLDLERRLGFAGREGHDDSDMSARCDGTPEQVVDNAIEANARVVARKGEDITLCVKGNRFPLDPDDAKRVVKWEKEKPGRALVIGDLLTVRVETREEGKDDKKTVTRYALTAHRTGGPDHPEALQSAMVVMEPSTGEIEAIVGSYDWSESQFNAATQANRQTGSSIKPYIYLSALMNGKTVISKVDDSPICIESGGKPWCPKNYKNDKMSQSYFGVVDLVTALAKSLNSVSVRLIIDVGLDKALGTMRALGIQSFIERVFPIATGTPELTLMEHTGGYASILSNGRKLPSQVPGGTRGIFVTKVTEYARDKNGQVVERVIYTAPAVTSAQAVPSGDAYAMTQIMRGVVEFGTSTRAKWLRRVVAGKTGTTNRFADAWFMGGTPDLVVGVWVGRLHSNQTIAKEATGGVVALPIWEGFMEAAHQVTEESPARDFPLPDDVTLIHKGEKREGIPKMIPFQRGKMPKDYLTQPSLKFGKGSDD